MHRRFGNLKVPFEGRTLHISGEIFDGQDGHEVSLTDVRWDGMMFADPLLSITYTRLINEDKDCLAAIDGAFYQPGGEDPIGRGE